MSHRTPAVKPPRPARKRYLAAAAALLLATAATASDHADPIDLDRQEGGITDLFVFPTKGGVRKVDKKAVSAGEADQLAVILCVRRSLTTSPPYAGLNEFEYSVFMDRHTTVRFDNPFQLKRYGGSISDPEGIEPDFSITIRLNDDTSIKDLRIETREGGPRKVLALKKDGQWETRPQGPFAAYSGVRDDPFIFPMFFGTNVIAMVFSIPLNYFHKDQPDFLVWATSARRGAQIDHVGRSQRTQLPRFDLLNTISPKGHVAALRMQEKDPGLKDDFLRTRIRPVFNLRPYDFEPDVMIFTLGHDKEAKYPNGRQLDDDVAKLTCDQGDCQLFELSYAVKDPGNPNYTNGRPTKNDKEFSDAFPYLADPWPDKEPTPPPELTRKNQMLVVFLVVAAVAVVLLPWVLYFRSVRRLRILAQRAPAAGGV